MPNVWLRPNNQRREADAAKALLTVPDGDHLTLMNVYNQYMLRMCIVYSRLNELSDFLIDKNDKNWAWINYLSARALQQAENVRAQLQRTMERFELDLISLDDQKKLFVNIRKSLVAGFFMQVAHKEGEKGNYLTVKDNQVNKKLDQVFSGSDTWGCFLCVVCRSLHCTHRVVWTPNLNGLFSTSLCLRLDPISGRCPMLNLSGV